MSLHCAILCNARLPRLTLAPLLPATRRVPATELARAQCDQARAAEAADKATLEQLSADLEARLLPAKTAAALELKAQQQPVLAERV